MVSLGYSRTSSSFSRGATYDDFSGQYFRIFEIIICCFVVAICNLMHDVETIFHLPCVLEIFSEIRLMPVKLQIASLNLQFQGHHSYFRKDFQMLLALKECQL